MRPNCSSYSGRHWSSFFVCLLMLLAESDIRLLWLLTALGFVLTAFAARSFLGESVSGIRWAGVVFSMIGAALITYSEHAKAKPPATPMSAQPEP